MSISSMTGFGKGETVGLNYTITTEIKTVNHRFKDFKFRMSSLFYPIEIDFRSRLESEFRRGSFDISVSYKLNEKKTSDFQVDPIKVQAFVDFLGPIIQKAGATVVASPTDFLRNDFFKEEDSKDQELFPLALEALDKAISALKFSRQQEGSKLAQKLSEHLASFEKNLHAVESLKAEYPEMVKNKLTNKLMEKLKDFKLDESRSLQEILYYLEKLEIDEEVNRAKIHLDKLRSVLKASGEVGRQIDFLLQELGRETNTIGSKSAHPEISSNVVEMKIQLEKVREQALNLE